MPGFRNHRSYHSSRHITQKSQTSSIKRNVLELEIGDGCPIALSVRVVALSVGHGLVIQPWLDGIDLEWNVGPRECIRDHIFLAGDMLDVGGEL